MYFRINKIADVIHVHLEKTKYHSLKSIIEHRVLTAHNDSARHWNSGHGLPFAADRDMHRVFSAINEFETHKNMYIDVHAWQLTPSNFREIVLTLYNLGYTDLYPVRLYHTPRGPMNFVQYLKKFLAQAFKK